MQRVKYQTFSLGAHRRNWQLLQPNACQFELTFRCDLRCTYCYTACYNQPGHFTKELSASQVCYILDKVYQAGVIWLTLTGGDPLTRKDFLEIYAYAKKKGFLISIFTNGCSMNKETVLYLKKNLPFAIEVTLNAVTEDTYEKISGKSHSFKKAMEAIALMRTHSLPLKIKTQVTRENVYQLPQIKKFVRAIGLKFHPDAILFPRLNKDKVPCTLRLEPEQIMRLNGKPFTKEGGCSVPLRNRDNRRLFFPCTITGGDGFWINPYGEMFLCNLMRKPCFNLLRHDLLPAMQQLLSAVRNRTMSKNASCSNYCRWRGTCLNCPGKAYLEKGDEEARLEYYCSLAGRKV